MSRKRVRKAVNRAMVAHRAAQSGGASRLPITYIPWAYLSPPGVLRHDLTRLDENTLLWVPAGGTPSDATLSLRDVLARSTEIDAEHAASSTPSPTEVDGLHRLRNPSPPSYEVRACSPSIADRWRAALEPWAKHRHEFSFYEAAAALRAAGISITEKAIDQARAAVPEWSDCPGVRAELRLLARVVGDLGFREVTKENRFYRPVDPAFDYSKRLHTLGDETPHTYVDGVCACGVPVPASFWPHPVPGCACALAEMSSIPAPPAPVEPGDTRITRRDSYPDPWITELGRWAQDKAVTTISDALKALPADAWDRTPSYEHVERMRGVLTALGFDVAAGPGHLGAKATRRVPRHVRLAADPWLEPLRAAVGTRLHFTLEEALQAVGVPYPPSVITADMVGETLLKLGFIETARTPMDGTTTRIYRRHLAVVKPPADVEPDPWIEALADWAQNGESTTIATAFDGLKETAGEGTFGFGDTRRMAGVLKALGFTDITRDMTSKARIFSRPGAGCPE